MSKGSYKKMFKFPKARLGTRMYPVEGSVLNGKKGKTVPPFILASSPDEAFRKLARLAPGLFTSHPAE